MLNNEFKKKFDAEKDPLYKTAVKNDFLFFMKKMDSIENVALMGALLKIKNLEDLKNIKMQTSSAVEFSNTMERSADYPGGIDALRQEVAQLFYSEGVYSENNNLKTNVAFIVEKDGSISNVKAEGDNFTFNRQAEIALYSVSEKFTPAYNNGNPVRYRFRLPLALTFE